MQTLQKKKEGSTVTRDGRRENKMEYRWKKNRFRMLFNCIRRGGQRVCDGTMVRTERQGEEKKDCLHQYKNTDMHKRGMESQRTVRLLRSKQ